MTLEELRRLFEVPAPLLSPAPLPDSWFLALNEAVRRAGITMVIGMDSATRGDRTVITVRGYATREAPAGFDALAALLMPQDAIAGCWTGVRRRLGLRA